MDITKFLINCEDVVSIEGIEYEYLELFNEVDSGFRYGFCLIGWVVFEGDSHVLVKWDSADFLPFLIILELNPNETFTSVSGRAKQVTNGKVGFADFFPIIDVIRTCFAMESRYWSELCLNFLLKNQLYFEQATFLQNYVDCTWCGQRIKHMILKYLSRLE